MYSAVSHPSCGTQDLITSYGTFRCGADSPVWCAGLVSLWRVGSLFPDQVSNPSPLCWKHGVLTTRPPEKSLWNL